MAILVDRALWQWRGRRWAHLVSDVSLDELHAFAARLGLERRWFQADHYDIPDEYRTRAIDLGAEAVDARVLLRRLKEAGLRRSPAQRRVSGGVGRGLDGDRPAALAPEHADGELPVGE